MQIIDLFDIPAASLDGVGGKARGLYQLHQAGLNVPAGFVLTDIEAVPEALLAARKAYVARRLEEVAVRSSARAEDGEDYSNAGQYASVLNVRGCEAVEAAVEKCLASLQGERARKYADTFLCGQYTTMTVVVQRQIDAVLAGVCFTADPTGDPGNVLIEVVEGAGEALVSGEKSAQATRIPVDSIDLAYIRDTVAPQGLLNAQGLYAIARDAVAAKAALGKELDTEWAIDAEGVLHWLQARPITVADVPDLNEFNSVRNLAGRVITSCNIGEMMPGAVTPLTLSTSVYGIDWGMRKMFVQAGAFGDMQDIPEGSCALSVGNHLFIDLTTIYEFGKNVVGANKDGADLSICGRVLEDVPDSDLPQASVWKRAHNGLRYVRILMSAKKAKAKLAALAENLEWGAEDTPQALYRCIDRNIAQLNQALLHHYITSSYSGSMNSALYIALQKDYENKEALKAGIAGVLENIDGIESVEILRGLRKIARCLLAENPEVAGYSAEEIGAYMEHCGEATRQAHEAFLQRHGHRAIREAEMRRKSWADDRPALMAYLKTVIASGGEELPVDRRTFLQNRETLLRGYHAPKRWIFNGLIRGARTGVGLREHSKSMIIKVIDQFKKAYNQLAERLVAEKQLVDADCIFFLTHAEIGKLVREGDTALLKKALARRRVFAQQELLCYPEVSVGCPQVAMAAQRANTGQALHGDPVSCGIASGPARVVRSAEDAQQLEKGEIMVSGFTDIGWSPYYCLINGLVTEVGSALSHGAVVAREYSLPLIVNVPSVTHIIKTGDYLSINAHTGEIVVLDEEDAQEMWDVAIV